MYTLIIILSRNSLTNPIPVITFSVWEICLSFRYQNNLISENTHYIPLDTLSNVAKQSSLILITLTWRWNNADEIK